MSSVHLMGVFMLVASFFIETLAFGSLRLWKQKQLIAYLVLFLTCLSASLIMAGNFTNGLLLLFLLSMPYRIINTYRLASSKINEQYLFNICSRSFAFLASFQLILVGLWLFVEQVNILPITEKTLTFVVLVVIAIVSAVIFVATTTNIISTKVGKERPLSDNELPTVTVAIAARNEIDTLENCLTSVLADNYPKLEIIVYDDDSHDKTLDIVRQFAHEGARFIKGGVIPSDWLAKNFAYQSLLDSATGEIIMFIGTDVRLHKDSLRKTVESMLAKNVDMLSVMPKRTKQGLLAAFIQPMRYWWELAVPRLRPVRPPVLSTAWLAKRQALLDEGGFNSFKRTIIPEEHFAKKFNNQNKYAFIRTNENLKITSHKKFYDQWETAVRTRYPQIHRRPELVYLRTIFLAALCLPFVLLPFLLLSQPIAASTMILALCAGFLIYSHVLISSYTNPVAGIIAPFNFPLIIILEIIALNISLYRYEFSKVIWKERNVSDKAMHVYTKLPELN